jgi:chaperonin GroES
MKNAQKSSKIDIVPLGDRVLVRPKKIEEKAKTASGIYLPTPENKEKPSEGVVMAVGEGSYNEAGSELDSTSSKEVGDKVIFSKYSYEEVKRRW